MRVWFAHMAYPFFMFLVVLAWLTTLVVLAPRAHADPIFCQTPSPCRVIILSTEEEQALTGPNQILDTAMQGRPLDLAGKVLYFRDKIRNAPAGQTVQPEAPPK